MSQPAPRPATDDDLLSLPEEVRAEVLAGAIVTAPAPSPKHSKARRALGSFLGGPFDGEEAVVRSAPFEQIELSVGRIFLPKT